MCTVTFFPLDQNSYYLSTNRDELISRKKALPPKIGFKNDKMFIRPIDGDKGGTWIAVNNQRLSLCIMNWYQAYEKLPENSGIEYNTRGNIIHKLIDSDSLSVCTQRLREEELGRYQPFQLIGIQINPMKIKRWQWNGKELQINNESIEQKIWVSAGLEYDEVLKKRKEVFQRFLQESDEITLQLVKKIHASQLPEPGKYAISMSTPKAHTVSNTIITSRPGFVKLHYLDGFPATSFNWVKKEMLIRKNDTSR